MAENVDELVQELYDKFRGLPNTKPAKDFTNCAIDSLVNHFISWLDSKLSA